MRKKRLAKNTVSSLLLQLTSVICGMILPQFIIKGFGSEVNGLVNSITQFLQIIAFLELGVGAVVQAALYKPLAERNESQISAIMVSASAFYRRLAKILLIYVVILAAVFPMLSHQQVDPLFSVLLILAMSISSFAQYYFGIVNGLLLNADQLGYISHISQAVTIILNTICCIILIQLGSSILLVKFISSIIYLARPLFLKTYVDRKYKINRKIKYEGEPIKQKWNGVAQHVSAVVLNGTDSIVLTTFATLSDVSIYSVYNMVVYGLNQLFMSLTGGVQALIGEMWARKEKCNMISFFNYFEWLVHLGATFIYTCTGVLILPFVEVYTTGVQDTCYIQPLFAFLITLANAMNCLRLPYNIMISASGHFKQTEGIFISAALINLVLSILMVHKWGLVGVAIGSVIAMSFQTILLAYYSSKKLLDRSVNYFLKHLLVDACVAGITVLLTNKISVEAFSYLSWFLGAINVALVCAFVSIIVNAVFYWKNTKIIAKEMSYKLRKIIKRN